MTAVKVLFAGAAEGAVSGLLTKVATVNKKVGADCLFCVGEFFGGFLQDKLVVTLTMHGTFAQPCMGWTPVPCLTRL